MAAAARLFLALWPTPAVQRALVTEREGWTWPRGTRLVATPKLHLTLHFLGDVPAPRIPELIAALDGPAARFTLRLDATEVWPHGVAVLRPTVVPGGLIALHERLGAALRRLELPVEARRYRPHLTLARDARSAIPPAAPPAIAWPVRSFVLAQSVPGPGGVYTPLASWPAASRP